MEYSRLFRLLPTRRLEHKDVIVLLAIILFAWQITGIFYTIMGAGMVGKAERKGFAAAAPSHSTSTKEPEDSYGIIGERNLFGSTDKSLADKQAKGEQSVPLASLLQIRGTVTGGDKFGFAVIEEQGKGKQGLYRIGDKVAGATVVRIMRDRVALRIAGKEEILRKVAATESPILPAGKRDTPAAPTAEGSRTISRNEIVGSLRDVGHMLSQAQIRQYFTAGSADGFIISNIQAGSIYQKLGLADGDIIQEINNHKIQGADDILELYNTMRSGSAMALKVKRQGRQEQFDYLFR